MPTDINVGSQTIAGFVLTLSRVTGCLWTIPLPGFQAASQTARIVLTVCITICLLPVWPILFKQHQASGILLGILIETASGLLLGITAAFLFEAFQLGAQIISAQAGFSFASTFDPQTQADTSIFQTFTQLFTGLLFFAVGLHRQLVRMIASPVLQDGFASGHLLPSSISLILQLGTSMFTTGFTLVLPVATLLLLIDIALAVVTRLQAQLQLLALAFPAKIAGAFLFFAMIIIRWPVLFERLSADMLNDLYRALSR
jgi:flagellar biosynthesis protein FliR